jgi:hypothetical protein
LPSGEIQALVAPDETGRGGNGQHKAEEISRFGRKEPDPKSDIPGQSKGRQLQESEEDYIVKTSSNCVRSDREAGKEREYEMQRRTEQQKSRTGVQIKGGGVSRNQCRKRQVSKDRQAIRSQSIV